MLERSSLFIPEFYYKSSRYLYLGSTSCEIHFLVIFYQIYTMNLLYYAKLLLCGPRGLLTDPDASLLFLALITGPEAASLLVKRCYHCIRAQGTGSNAFHKPGALVTGLEVEGLVAESKASILAQRPPNYFRDLITDQEASLFVQWHLYWPGCYLTGPEISSLIWSSFYWSRGLMAALEFSPLIQTSKDISGPLLRPSNIK